MEIGNLHPVVFIAGIVAILLGIIIAIWVVVNMAKGKNIIVAAVSPDMVDTEQDVPEQETKKVLEPVRVESPIVVAPVHKVPVAPPAREKKTTRYAVHDLDEEIVAVIMAAISAMGYSASQVASIRPKQGPSHWALEGRFQSHKSL